MKKMVVVATLAAAIGFTSVASAAELSTRDRLRETLGTVLTQIDKADNDMRWYAVQAADAPESSQAWLKKQIHEQYERIQALQLYADALAEKIASIPE